MSQAEQTLQLGDPTGNEPEKTEKVRFTTPSLMVEFLMDATNSSQ